MPLEGWLLYLKVCTFLMLLPDVDCSTHSEARITLNTLYIWLVISTARSVGQINPRPCPVLTNKWSNRSAFLSIVRCVCQLCSLPTAVLWRQRILTQTPRLSAVPNSAQWCRILKVRGESNWSLHLKQLLSFTSLVPDMCASRLSNWDQVVRSRGTRPGNSQWREASVTRAEKWHIYE